MSLDFSSQNLQGRSFKGQDLTGANFSYADIRGADFTNAILIDANFSEAKAGLQRHWTIVIVTVSLLLSVLLGLISGFSSLWVGFLFTPEFANQYGQDGSVVGVSLLFMLVFFFFVTIRQGSAAGAIAAAAVAAGIAVGGAIIPVARAETVAVAVPVAMAAAMAVTTAVIRTMAVTVAAVVAAAGAVAGVVAAAAAWAVAGIGVMALAAAVARAGAGAGAVARNMAVAVAVAGAMGVAGAALGIYIAWRALAGDEKHAVVRTVAIAFAAIGGTSFRKANLTNATFTRATLKNTDFRGAILTRTRWHEAKKLDRARVGDSILRQHCVRDLLVTGNGYKKSYEAANLKGANLAGANLNEANLQEADISQATLQAANLEGTNLTQANAVGTDFTNAYLTGACLEAWNIDSTTKLEQIDCRYVYLLQGERERRPSSGEFQAGEFTKLFQEILNTVDLIFRSGVDWKAFVTAFKQVQVENEGTELAIQSIENKGDGVIVVKVSVPPDANKEKIHSGFMQNYELALEAIEEKYQAKLEAKDELIVSYRQQLEDYRHTERKLSADMKEIVSLLASKPVNVPVNVPEIKVIAERQSQARKLVILTLGDGDFERGFPSVTAQIWTGNEQLPIQCIGQLPPAPELPELYSRCQSIYKGLDLRPRIKPKSIKMGIYKKDIYPLAGELEERLNKWFDSETFRPIDKSLREIFMRSDEVPLIIQSENINVHRLPWHLWDFIKSYRKAEVALSVPFYDRVEKTAPSRGKKRILAILGNSTGINIEEDRKVLENLPDVETVFMVEPNRKELDKLLWDEQGWDILCFSGHSSSEWDGKNGWIYINQTDKLTIDQLKNALGAAIERGLQLAIFNSCNGLGLSRQLASLHIPQIIVMREPVPDLVAQEFLKNFLRAFASGKSFYVAVRQAREMLQGLEDECPCASWLPVICQNPAEVPLVL